MITTLLVTACGMTGDLYLPEENKKQVQDESISVEKDKGLNDSTEY